MKIEKFVLPTETLKKKEAIKMIKKCLAITLATLIIVLNVVPAQAYVELKTPVSITATGTITGSTIAFSAVVVPQIDGTPQTQVDFASTSNTTVTNSGDALKIKGGTNVVGGRVVVYTDNASYFTSQDHDPRVKKVSGVYKPTGIDGAGLVGQTEPGYVAGLVWAVSTTPNVPAAYAFNVDANQKPTNSVYVVDRGHTLSFVPPAGDILYTQLPAPFNTPAGLDGTSMYPAVGTTAITNNLNEGVDVNGNPVALYPQKFGTLTVPPAAAVNDDLYDKVSTDSTRKVVSQQLTKNIATIAYNVAPGTGTDAGFYVCQVPNLTTPATDDSVAARLGKADSTAGSELFVNIGGIFIGLPAQTYNTTKLYVAMLQD